MKEANIVKRAADMAVSKGGKTAGKKDKCGEVFGQCIVQAMVVSSCMGAGTNYFHCQKLFSSMTTAQVTLMKWCISSACDDLFLCRAALPPPVLNKPTLV